LVGLLSALVIFPNNLQAAGLQDKYCDGHAYIAERGPIQKNDAFPFLMCDPNDIWFYYGLGNFEWVIKDNHMGGVALKDLCSRGMGRKIKARILNMCLDLVSNKKYCDACK
jgi:hypothetical protein